MASFKEMQRNGVIKRADKSLIRYADIHVKPGFNLRDESDPDFADDIASLVAHMSAGGNVPALEVVPRDDGGVWLVDGHRRHIAYGRMIEAGMPIEFIEVTQFIGNDMQRTARILTSQEGRKLKPLEIAEGYRRLEAFGLSHDDIARLVHKTRTHVAQMLVLNSAPHAVHEAVKAGEISATDATKLARAEGDGAGEKLAEMRGKAKAQGKKKITAAVTRQWTPPAKHVAPLISNLDDVITAIPLDVRAQITSDEPTAGLDDVTVSIPLTALRNLFEARNVIAEAEDKARTKLREKANKAAQSSLPGTDGA